MYSTETQEAATAALDLLEPYKDDLDPGLLDGLREIAAEEEADVEKLEESMRGLEKVQKSDPAGASASEKALLGQQVKKARARVEVEYLRRVSPGTARVIEQGR